MRLRRPIAVLGAVVLAFALGYATRRGGEDPGGAGGGESARPGGLGARGAGAALRPRSRPRRAGLGAHGAAADQAAGRSVHDLSDLCAVRRAPGRHGRGLLRRRRARARAGHRAAHRERRPALARRTRGTALGGHAAVGRRAARARPPRNGSGRAAGAAPRADEPGHAAPGRARAHRARAPRRRRPARRPLARRGEAAPCA